MVCSRFSDLQVRRGACRVLVEWEVRPRALDGLCDDWLAHSGKGCNPAQAGLFTSLVTGVVRRRRRLDWLIDKLRRRQKKIKPKVRMVLRLALFELEDEGRRPDYAIVSEAVNLARAVAPGSEGFVNGILRSFLREGADRLLPPGDGPESLAVRWSLPTWLVESWVADYGPEIAARLCRSANLFPGTGFRVNRLQGSRAEFFQKLATDGFDDRQLRPGRYARQAFYSFQAAPLLQGKWFREGLLTVQDEGAQLIGELLAPKPGETILDACAAPGGKSTHLAELSDDRALILALDRDAERLALVEESSRRLGLSSITTRALDLTAPLPPDLPQGYDAILVDAPCSGLGVIRRRADLRWRKTPGDSRTLQTIQLQILKNCSTYLKPGGRLVYATCTTRRAENHDVAAAFLTAAPGFHRADRAELEKLLPAAVVSREGFLETMLLPESPMDGFFAALFIKN